MNFHDKDKKVSQVESVADEPKKLDNLKLDKDSVTRELARYKEAFEYVTKSFETLIEAITIGAAPSVKRFTEQIEKARGILIPAESEDAEE